MITILLIYNYNNNARNIVQDILIMIFKKVYKRFMIVAAFLRC